MFRELSLDGVGAMRRLILTTAICVISFAATSAQAGRFFGGGADVPESVTNGAPPYTPTPGYTTFGRKLRGGFGRNGFAPVWGPVWGPRAFTPATGKGDDLRPNGAYVKSPYVLPEMGPPAPPVPTGKLFDPPAVELEAVEIPMTPKDVSP
jgi:hypothetical protein